MDAENLDFETIKPIDLNGEALKPRSKATPFSTFIWAVVSGDIATAEAQITDDIEWGMMPYNKVIKGKDKVITPSTKLMTLFSWQRIGRGVHENSSSPTWA